MWPYLTTGQRPKKDNTAKEGFLEVVRRKPGYNVLWEIAYEVFESQFQKTTLYEVKSL